MNPVLESELVGAHPPFRECHASTIAATPLALVVAFFAGSREGHPNVGIWSAWKGAGAWSPASQVAAGAAHDGTRYPCWNPVLFQPASGPLLLFYKVGPSPRDWWGMLARSQDHGRTWEAPERLPERVWGPIKNKPVQLDDGTLLCPTSSEDNGFQVFLQRTSDLGQTWQTIGPLNDAAQIPAIQPAALVYPSGRMQLLCRTKCSRIATCWSEDGGWTWSPMRLTGLPNPNSGLDAVVLPDGRALLVYNHTGTPLGQWGGARSPLNVAVSEDGIHWEAALVLEDEPGEYSYPAMIAVPDGKVHITYTWRRRNIAHVALNVDALQPVTMPGDEWPSAVGKATSAHV